MTNFVWPVLPGLAFPVVRVPQWRNGRQEAVSGKESTVKYRRYPRIRWELQYELLRDDITVSEAKAIAGLFNACGGSYDTFLYTDPDYNTVTLESFGTGDGATTAFQLIATYQNSGGPGAPERVQNLSGAPQIYKAGVLQTLTTHYTIGPTGLVTFVTAPTGGQALTWSGSFYYRCRFEGDELVMTKIMSQWWELPVAFRSVPL
jgi:uncharacterized protein (TIGR02217 family)